MKFRRRHKNRRVQSRPHIVKRYRKPLLLTHTPPTRINSNNANFSLKLRRGRRLSVVELNHSQALANRKPILPKLYDKPLTINRKPANIICKKRKQRREVLFATGVAGSHKVKFAKWNKDSYERCT